MWAWVSFAIGFFLGMSTGIFVIALLKQCSPPERGSDYESMASNSKDSLKAGFFTESTPLMIPDSYRIGDTEDRGQAN